MSISITLAGDVIRLFVPDDTANEVLARTEQPGFASFPETRTKHQYSAIVSIVGPEGASEVQLSDMRTTFPIIEMLNKEEVLIVGPRCQRYTDGTAELNARVYDLHGEQKREFLLGDGINHAQADAKGNIWVGYFDEGVFGNFGWGGEPLGAAGLSCFSPDGRKLWDFEPPQGFDSIADCYALNVTSTGAWAYYYSGFPIAWINTEWVIHCWKTESSGGHTFAVGDEQILLFGGYRTERSACKLLAFTNGEAKSIARVSLVLPKDLDLSSARVIGRGRELHVFSADDWFVFSTDSLRL